MRRSLLIVASAAIATLALYSCSMHAAITTDASGRVIDVPAVRIESSLRQVATVALLVVGGHVAVELRWLRPHASDSRAGAGRVRAGSV